jgi:hypothetical protein
MMPAVLLPSFEIFYLMNCFVYQMSLMFLSDNYLSAAYVAASLFSSQFFYFWIPTQALVGTYFELVGISPVVCRSELYFSHGWRIEWCSEIYVNFDSYLLTWPAKGIF